MPRASLRMLGAALAVAVSCACASACHEIVPYDHTGKRPADASPDGPPADASPDGPQPADASPDGPQPADAFPDGQQPADAAPEVDAPIAPPVIYHVRADNRGDDDNDGLSWQSALATIQSALNRMQLESDSGPRQYIVRLAATIGGQYYEPAGIDGRINRPFEVHLQGGFTDFDAGPDARDERSRSHIRGSGTDGIGIGLLFCARNGEHGASQTVSLDRVDLSDVMVGVSLSAAENLGSIRPSLTLTRSSVTSGLAGVSIEWPIGHLGHGPCRISLLQSTINAGRRSTTDASAVAAAVFIHGPMAQVSLDESVLRSDRGEGIAVSQTGDEGSFGSPEAPMIRLERSAIRNCAGPGIRWRDEGTLRYGQRSLSITLDKSRVVYNKGPGLHVTLAAVLFGGTDDGRIAFSEVNSIIASNESHGLWLQGDGNDNNSGDHGSGQVVLAVINSTIADNAGDGINTETTHWISGAHRVHNAILSGNAGAAVRISASNAPSATLFESYNLVSDNEGGAFVLLGKLAEPNGTDRFDAPEFATTGMDPYRLEGPVSLLCTGAQSSQQGGGVEAPRDDILGVQRPTAENCWTAGAYQRP